MRGLDLEYTNRMHIGLSLSLALSGALIAAFYGSVTSYFGLLGGTAGTMMAGTIPAISYLRLKGELTKPLHLLIIGFYGAMTAIGIAGGIISVVYTRK